MTSVVVELCDVEKKFLNLPVLTSMSFSLAAGEVLGLLGHNGAGKSTLMKIILGLIKPCSGSVLSLADNPASNQSFQYRRQFGYLPENVSFYEQLSGKEVLTFFARLKGVSKKSAVALLAEVGLSEAADRAVKTYSKGMRQRLGLAQALLGEPRLLLLDEPTVGLDPVATSDFYKTVDRLKDRGCAVILCSHVLPGVESHIDKAMILKQGQCLAFGSLEQLRKSTSLPLHIVVKGVSKPVLDQQLKGVFPLYVCERISQESLRVTVSDDEKIHLLRHLINIPGLQDLQIHEPSLDTLYHHFQQIDSVDDHVAGQIDSSLSAPTPSVVTAEGIS